MAPSHADLQSFFNLTPPSVNSMLVRLERCGFIRRVPGKARAIEVLVPAAHLPPLERPFKFLLGFGPGRFARYRGCDVICPRREGLPSILRVTGFGCVAAPKPRQCGLEGQPLAQLGIRWIPWV